MPGFAWLDSSRRPQPILGITEIGCVDVRSILGNTEIGCGGSWSIRQESEDRPYVTIDRDVGRQRSHADLRSRASASR